MGLGQDLQKMFIAQWIFFNLLSIPRYRSAIGGIQSLIIAFKEFGEWELSLSLSFHLYAEEWLFSYEDTGFHMHINFTSLNFLWADDWNFPVFGVFVWCWMYLGSVFCNLHWDSKSILWSLTKWLHFQKCRSQPFCYLITKCSDQNLWTCLVCVTKSISNGFKYFHSLTHFSKFCFLLQLLGLDWQLWIKVHWSSSIQFLPFPSLTHLLFSNCSSILSVISGVWHYWIFPPVIGLSFQSSFKWKIV